MIYFVSDNDFLWWLASYKEEQGGMVEAAGSLRLLDGSSDFVLTYEDKEGDWMLVGDVPWEYVSLSTLFCINKYIDCLSRLSSTNHTISVSCVILKNEKVDPSLFNNS